MTWADIKVSSHPQWLSSKPSWQKYVPPNVEACRLSNQHSWVFRCREKGHTWGTSVAFLYSNPSPAALRDLFTCAQCQQLTQEPPTARVLRLLHACQAPACLVEAWQEVMQRAEPGPPSDIPDVVLPWEQPPVQSGRVAMLLEPSPFSQPFDPPEFEWKKGKKLAVSFSDHSWVNAYDNAMKAVEGWSCQPVVPTPSSAPSSN